jgi:hypothetical protein
VPLDHTCIIATWGGDWEDFCSTPGKKLARPHLNQWLGVVLCPCQPLREAQKEAHDLGWAWQKMRPYFKNNQWKKDWWHGSSGTEPPSSKHEAVSSTTKRKKIKKNWSLKTLSVITWTHVHFVKHQWQEPFSASWSTGKAGWADADLCHPSRLISHSLSLPGVEDSPWDMGT